MMQDSQSVTGFGGQVGNVAFPGKIMADSDTQKLERKDFFQRIVGISVCPLYSLEVCLL